MDNLYFPNMEGFSKKEAELLKSTLHNGKIMIKSQEQLQVYRKFIKNVKAKINAE